MNTKELLEKLELIPEENRLNFVKSEIRKIGDPREREIAETCVLAGMSLAKSAPEKIVVLIHGIRTHAEWQERLAEQLNNVNNIRVYPVGYGYLDVLRFWCPLWTRREPIDKILRELRAIRTNHKNSEISVVAHSFGTYIISQILADATDVELQRLQLCGSIIHTKYRWDKVKYRIKGIVVNDVGTKDIWPVLASLITWGYGVSGTFGFKTSFVSDRYHNCEHSDFFDNAHMRKYWIPLIVDGQNVKSEWTGSRPSPGKLVTILNIIPLKTLVFSTAIIYGLLRINFLAAIKAL
ncbi:hypothetical protein GTP91_00875 [Rugamonas sp. FT82W]|uniref:Serine aminopeptidase S33 domain-containing protein n=1 Tax=Duganella vulcania TaxID=2692166 RepID=A0A845FYQ6_9BURK|nr:alpha/beta hydrolase [Duganella vulcania]MYM85726.1 hypothetical protein [Duganella vulcania]